MYSLELLEHGHISRFPLWGHVCACVKGEGRDGNY